MDRIGADLLSRQIDFVPHIVTTVAGARKDGPDKRLAIGRYAVEYPLVDYALGHAFAIDRIAIDKPHSNGLTQAVRPLRILVDVLAVEFEPIFAPVVGEHLLVAVVLRRIEEERLGLDATVYGRVDGRTCLLKAPLQFQAGVGSIKIDPPGADDRQFCRIHLV